MPLRFASLVVACGFLPAGSLALPPAVDYVSIDLGEDIADRMSHLQLSDGHTQVESIGGRTARRNVSSSVDLHFYFAVDDGFAFQGSRPDLYITIDYYDTGSGTLGLQYDSSDPAPFPNDRYKSAGSVTLTNAKQWKTRTFQVADAYFGNRQNGGADFRIVKPGGGFFYIDRVTVTIPRSMSSALGSTHASGKYFFDPGRDYLNEGAIEIANAGLRVIKLWFTPDNPGGYYRWNSQWPGAVGSLKALAEHPYWRELLRRPFDTYVLTIFEHRSFRNGFPDPGPAVLAQDFYDLARYLLETYRGTGKTFILGHHEGDWHLRGTTDQSPAYDPGPTAIQGMIRWYNARQAGVTRARNEVGPSGVNVYAAAEVNLVKLAMQGRPTVTNDVLPHTNMDLVSYSAYDTVVAASTNESGARQDFRNALAHLAEKMPDSSTPGPDGRPFGADNVFVAEYGGPEQQWGSSGGTYQQRVTRVAVEEAFAFGCPWIIYWEVFCNECCQPGDNPCVPNGGPVSDALPADRNELCRGFWLRRADGTFSPAWSYLTGRVGPYLKPVTDLSATRPTSSTVRLEWPDGPEEESYRIERSENGGPFIPVATPPADSVSYVDTGRVPGSTFRYRLRSERAGREPTAWFHVDVAPTRLPGDSDEDGDVDQSDFGALQRCLGEHGGSLSATCEPADLDGNRWIDASDVTIFLQCVSGPGAPSGC